MASRGSSTWAIENYGKPCIPDDIVRYQWYPGLTKNQINIHDGTQKLWAALGAIFLAYGYKLPTSYVGAYSCRNITSGRTWSRHSWPIAMDVNAATNPYIDHSGSRTIYWGRETDMPANMIAEIEKITASGIRAFTWGGRWVTIKDAMHFQIRVTLSEISGGVYAPRGFYGGGSIPGGEDEMSLLGYDIGKMGEPSVKGEKSATLQKMLVDRGQDLGEWGDNKDGVDGSAGDDTRRGLHDWKVEVGITENTSAGEGKIGPYEYAAFHPDVEVGDGKVGKHTHPATVSGAIKVKIGENA
jgi:hypothetical protein